MRLSHIIKKGGIPINNYNPYDDIFKDERIIIDSKDTFGDLILFKAHLVPNDNPFCPKCKSLNVIKHGFYHKNIIDSVFIDYKSRLILTIQKFKCKNCSHIFQDTTSIIESKENITIHLRLLILHELKSDVSLTYVARKYNLSVQTVYNIFEKYVYVKRHHLTEVICIDEFKNLKTEDGKYAAVILDPMKTRILDIVENRRLEKLNDYFYRLSLEEKEFVKYFISDMYEPYRSVKKEFFPNAIHIVDHFHFARYVYDAADKVRIRIMNSYPKDSKEYRLLKKYWHLFVMPVDDLKILEQYNPMRKRKTSTSVIMSDYLNIDDELQLVYDLKELFIHIDKTAHYETRNESLKRIIKEFRDSEIDEFISVANMFENWFVEIGNSYIRFGDKRLNNAYLEGTNNRIKEIKKISYGCDSFYYFRNRLMYVINGDEPIGRVDTSKIPRTPRK